MPIVKTLKPNDGPILMERIFSTVPGEEAVVIDAVRDHLELWGWAATYHQCRAKPREVSLASKSTIFLIQGTFRVGSPGNVVEVGLFEGVGVGHVIDDEDKILLGKYSAVVVIAMDDAGLVQKSDPLAEQREIKKTEEPGILSTLTMGWL